MKWLLSILIFVIGCSSAKAQEDAALLYLKNGQTRQGQVVAVLPDRLELRLAGVEVGALNIPYEQMSYVEFPGTALWKQAVGEFTSRNYDAAAKKFETLAKRRDLTQFYPAPGNFASLADRRLLDCYRRINAPEAIPEVADRMEWNLLPPDERGVQPVIAVWVALGKQEWESVLQEAEKVAKDLEPGDPAIGELAYLRGVALESSGRADEALLAYGKVTGLFPGQNRRLATEALRRMAEILETKPARSEELKAVVQIYAKSFGNGDLWEGASSDLRQLAKDSSRP